MQDTRLWFIVLAAIAVWVFLKGVPNQDDPGRGPTATEPRPLRATESRILEDKTFESYAECDDAAAAAAQELKDQGLSVALASKNALAGSTIYKVYYRGATGQISCRGGRLVNEIFEPS